MLEDVRIVDGDAVEERCPRQNRVPRFLHARHATAADVVTCGWPLKISSSLLLRTRFSSSAVIAQRKFGWLMCGTPSALRMASTFRCSTSLTACPPAARRAPDVQSVDVDRLLAEPVGDFLTLHHQKFLVGAVQRVQPRDRRQEVVVGEHEELVAVLAVPAHDFVRRADRRRNSACGCGCCPCTSARGGCAALETTTSAAKIRAARIDKLTAAIGTRKSRFHRSERRRLTPGTDVWQDGGPRRRATDPSEYVERRFRRAEHRPAAACFGGYYLGAQIGFLFQAPDAPQSVLWLPNSILLAVLLAVPFRAWPAYLLAAFPAQMLIAWGTGAPALTMALLFTTNCADAALGAFLSRRFSGVDGPFRFDGLRSMVIFAAFGATLATLLLSFADAGISVATDWSTSFQAAFVTRVRSNILTHLIVVPALIDAVGA